MNEFWRSWKLSETEKNAVKSLRNAFKILFDNFASDEIVAIYVKGSFIRREMNKGSDVDTLTVLRHSKDLARLKRLADRYRENYEPNIEFSGYSLWELKRNKRSVKGKPDRAAPNRAVEHLDEYKLLYGRKLNKKDFFDVGHRKRLESMIKVFEDRFIPDMSFDVILKQVFWLVENEQKYLGKEVSHNWKKMADSIGDKNHIVHYALYLRGLDLISPKMRSEFMCRLKDYLASIKKTL